MAIQSRFLQTPTGRTYDPARDIERSFDKTSGIVTNAINERTKYKQEQENAFGQLYSNLGELESNLQQNYAGINQQMVDSTREFMKEHYKKGGRSSDPEFQSQLGQMTGRIKAGMSNADRNREMLKQSAELIKSDSAITDKAPALAALYKKIQDPDFLISQNEFDPSEVLDQFVDPRAVYEANYKSQPSQGEWGNQYTDERGNLRQTDVILNRLINKDQPVTEDGRVNINLTPEYIQEVMTGQHGQRLLDITMKAAKRDYPDLSTDIAFSKSLKSGIESVAGLSYKNKFLKSATDIESEAKSERLDNQYRQSQINKNNKDDKDEEARIAENNRFQKFNQAATAGDIGFLGEYENQDSDISDIKWNNEYQKEIDLNNQLKSVTDWSSLSKDERHNIVNAFGLEDEVPSVLMGMGMDTNNEESFNLLKAKMKEFLSEVSKNPTSITYKKRTGTKQGKAVTEDVKIPIRDEQELVNAFRTLENLRRSGKGLQNENEVNIPPKKGELD